jgi:hypothetical protein
MVFVMGFCCVRGHTWLVGDVCDVCDVCDMCGVRDGGCVLNDGMNV